MPQTYAIDLHPGQLADVTVNERPGRTFVGKVARTADALDQFRTLLSEVQVDNSGELVARHVFPGEVCVDAGSPDHPHSRKHIAGQFPRHSSRCCLRRGPRSLCTGSGWARLRHGSRNYDWSEGIRELNYKSGRYPHRRQALRVQSQSPRRRRVEDCYINLDGLVPDCKTPETQSVSGGTTRVDYADRRRVAQRYRTSAPCGSKARRTQADHTALFREGTFTSHWRTPWPSLSRITLILNSSATALRLADSDVLRTKSGSAASRRSAFRTGSAAWAWNSQTAPNGTLGGGDGPR